MADDKSGSEVASSWKPSPMLWTGIIVGLAAFLADSPMKYIAAVIVLLAVVCILIVREWNGIPPERRR
jgi:hypothetical protein